MTNPYSDSEDYWNNMLSNFREDFNEYVWMHMWAFLLLCMLDYFAAFPIALLLTYFIK